MSAGGRNPEQKPSRVTRVTSAGPARARGKGPVSDRAAVAAERGHAPGPVAPGATPDSGAPIPGRGPKSDPRSVTGPPYLRDLAAKGDGSTIASRANAAGKRRGVAG